MARQFSPADLDAQARLRDAFDPDGLANPGKVLPEGSRCGDIMALPPAARARPGPIGRMGLTAPAAALSRFAEEVGGEGPVAVEGGRTHWRSAASRRPAPAWCGPRRGPAVEPAEMTVSVLAGTPVADLQAALAEVGQCVNLPAIPAEGATVGGVVAVGRSGLRRLGWGPLRDTVLQVRYVSAEGLPVTGGGPTVKNVTGFDLPRLLVGLARHARAARRGHPAHPTPAPGRALAGRSGRSRRRCGPRSSGRPSLLWDGDHDLGAAQRVREPTSRPRADVAAEALRPGRGGRPAAAAAATARRCRPARAAPASGRSTVRFVAEVGVGVVHWPRRCRRRRRVRGRRAASADQGRLRPPRPPQPRPRPPGGGRRPAARRGLGWRRYEAVGRRGPARHLRQPAGCACPTARPSGSTGEERYSPRGRIEAMRQVHLGGRPADRAFHRHDGHLRAVPGL